MSNEQRAMSFVEQLLSESETKVYFSDGSVATDRELIAAAEFAEQALTYRGLRENPSTGSALAESGFIPEGSMGKKPQGLISSTMPPLWA